MKKSFVFNLNEYLEWLDQNQWLNLIFLFLAIIGILLSIYLFRKARRTRKPVFAVRSTNFISNNIMGLGDIEVKYRGENIENLTVSKFAIWNRGNETINESDQAPTDHLRIEALNHTRILDAVLVYQSERTNNIRLTRKDHILEIDFDYFDKGQGGIVKLIHTGNKSSDLTLRGTFKGSISLKKIRLRIYDFGLIFDMSLRKVTGNYSHRLRRIMLATAPIAMTLSGVFLGLTQFFIDIKTNQKWAFLVIGTFYSITGLILLYRNTILPKGFEVFFDDE